MRSSWWTGLSDVHRAHGASWTWRPEPAAGDVWIQGVRGCRGPDVLWDRPAATCIGAPRPTWTRSSRAPSPPTCPSSSRQVRAGDQPQDRQGPRPDDPAVAAAAGGSGDRVMDRRAFIGTAGWRPPRRAARRRGAAGGEGLPHRVAAPGPRRLRRIPPIVRRLPARPARARARSRARTSSSSIDRRRGARAAARSRGRAGPRSRLTSSSRGARRRAMAAKQATETIPIVIRSSWRSGRRSGSSPASRGRAGTSPGCRSMLAGAGRQAARAAQGGRSRALAGWPSSRTRRSAPTPRRLRRRWTRPGPSGVRASILEARRPVETSTRRLRGDGRGAGEARARPRATRLLVSRRARIADLAARHRLPAIYRR